MFDMLYKNYQTKTADEYNCIWQLYIFDLDSYYLLLHWVNGFRIH